MNKVYSSQSQLKLIADTLKGYLKLPFTTETVPGALMEAILANVRHAEVLRTYDFIDVVDKANRIGWQVKSTKETTPLTWKRAKIRNAQKLIEASRTSDKGLQDLGDAIIAFCNEHAEESIQKYDLEAIGYSRLVVHDNGTMTYFERLLCTRENPVVFNSKDYTWKWAIPKNTKGKEQLPALHGTDKKTGKKAFAWHGLGENQLHYSGEKTWWPTSNTNSVKFDAPATDARLSYEKFAEMLTNLA